MDVVERKRRDRLRIMALTYQVTEGKKNMVLNGTGVAEELGLDPEYTIDQIDYLIDEGLLVGQGYSYRDRHFSIHHYGVVEVEESMAAPDRPTEHFAAAQTVYNITNHIQAGGHVTLQQASPGAMMDTRIMESSGSLAELLDEIVRRAPELGLKPSEREHLAAEAEQAKQQLSRQQPNWAAVLAFCQPILVFLSNTTSPEAVSLAQRLAGLLSGGQPQ